MYEKNTMWKIGLQMLSAVCEMLNTQFKIELALRDYATKFHVKWQIS